MNRILCCLALYLLSLSLTVLSASGLSTNGTGVEKPVNGRQNDISIICPTQISYRIEAVEQWEAGFHAVKRLTFADAAVTGRTLVCNYSVNDGSARDSTVLMRETPAGYVCKNDHVAGSKNRQFLCKRAVAPIKIKPRP